MTILGGPLIREDGTLVGVASGMLFENDVVGVQVFTQLSRYFDWISYNTGLELPRCQNQAFIYA